MCANGFGDGMVTKGHVELGWWVRMGLGGEWGPWFGGVDLAMLTWGLWPVASRSYSSSLSFSPTTPSDVIIRPLPTTKSLSNGLDRVKSPHSITGLRPYCCGMK